MNNSQGKLVLGVRQLYPEEYNLYTEENPPEPPALGSTFFSTDYSVRFFTSGCYFHDYQTEDWASYGCQVSVQHETSLVKKTYYQI